MGLLKLCRLLLTNDTGPMHLAAALGTPVVALFGSTSPDLTGPLPFEQRCDRLPRQSGAESGEGAPSSASNTHGHRILKSDVPCSPCFLRTCPIDFRCMMSISVESVVDAALQSIR
jgi:heptosyltransferase-2